MSNMRRQQSGSFDTRSRSHSLLSLPLAAQLTARPHSMQLKVQDNVEDLVNACLDTSGIDRRYSAIILEELRDCTNLTSDQMRQAAHEITATLGSNSPQYASLTSSAYDSAATNLPSSDENLYDSSMHFSNA